MATLTTTEFETVTAFCGCDDGARENKMPVDVYESSDGCLACGEAYRLVRTEAS